MVVNCLEGLIDSIVGESDIDSQQRLRRLAEHMVSHSFFFPREIVDEQHKKMIVALEKNEPLPVRYSTVSDCYCDSDANLLEAKTKADLSKTPGVFYRFRESRIPVAIDSDGNRSVRKLIKDFTGHIISQGATSTITYATISHIWGQAFNPLFFTSLWNIVIVPTYCNPILDKTDDVSEDDEFSKEVAYINKVYKKICYEYYNVKEKLEDFKKLGFDLTPFVSYCDVDFSLEELPFLPKVTKTVATRATVTQENPVQPHSDTDNQAADEDSLKRDLQTIGLKTFVDFYEAFADSQYTVADIKSMLYTCGYSPNSINTKASMGKRIIRNGQGQEALQRVLQSGRIDETTRQRAMDLLTL